MPPHVVVLYNQPSLPEDHPESYAEQEVLYTLDFVCDALCEAGLRVSRLEVGRDPAVMLAGLRELRPDAVLNLFEGLPPDEGTSEVCVPALLEWLGVPFTGSPALSLSLSRNKPLMKLVLQAAGLPTPPFFTIERLADLPRTGPVSGPTPALRWPVFVKSGTQHASIGIDQGSVVTGRAALRKRAGLLLERYGPPVLVEQFIPGRELTVGVVEAPQPRPLPISEFVFKPRTDGGWPIVTYETKWDLESKDFEFAPFCDRATLSARLTRKLQTLAVRAFRTIGLRDYGRIDFRLTPEGGPFILEANPNPDISPDAGLAVVVEGIGLTYDTFIAHLAKRALARGQALPALASEEERD